MINIHSINTPNDLYNIAINELKKGVESSLHEFHTGTFSTSTNNIPESRTVVIRKISSNPLMVRIHSDNRSKKNSEIKINPYACLLLYSKQLKLQVRLSGKAKVLEEQTDINATFMGMSDNAKACYAHQLSSGDIIHKKQKESIGQSIQLPLTPAQLDLSKQNFSIVQIFIQTIDILYLHHSGHVRTFGKWNDSNDTWTLNFCCS